MAAIDHLIKVLCVSLSVASAFGSSEDSTKDFIENILRIPNPDKVLNSVLDRLQRNRQLEFEQRQLMADQTDCDKPVQIFPEYTESLNGPKERGLRQLSVQKHYPICHLERKIKKLNTNEYEYRPAYYEEVKCSSNMNEELGITNEICSSLGFTCVQWNKTIHLTRRRYSSDCWETKTMVIPAGCECMWPLHRLGDISLHE